MIPLGHLFKVVVAKGRRYPTENALLSAYIYVDIRHRDIGGASPTPTRGGGGARSNSVLAITSPVVVRLHGPGHRDGESSFR
ncbi:MAG: hypothetical protein IPP88_14095 [Betaproteobacteria bacterium]|nr:hypothetical protein [Betaproteobacteria bacterium]